MKTIVLALLCCISSIVLAQDKKLKLYNYSYSINPSLSPSGGVVENVQVENDTTTITFSVFYESYNFDSIFLYMSGDTLVMDVMKFDMELCFCGESVEKYLFELKFEKIETLPINFKFIHNGKSIVEMQNKTQPQIISPILCKQINHNFYNYQDKYGTKHGPWLIDNDSCIWTFDSLYVFDQGEIISRSFITDQPFAESDSIIYYYKNEKLINEIERIDGYSIEKYYTYYTNTYEVIIADPRINSKKYDRVLMNLTYSDGDNYLIKKCLLYIDGKRIVKTKCSVY